MSLLITALQKAEKSRNESGARRTDDLALEPLDPADFTTQDRAAYDPAHAATLLTAGERISPLGDFVRDHSFGLVLSLLLLAGVGWGIYVWLQIQSPAIFAPKPAPVLAASGPAVQPAPVVQSSTAAQTTPAVQTPAQPSQLAAPVEVKSERLSQPTASSDELAAAELPKVVSEPERKPVAKESVQAPAPTPAPERVIKETPTVAGRAAPAARGEREIKVNRATETPPEKPLTIQAYNAFQTGNYAAAKTLYEEARRAQPKSADSLLGLAAIAALEGNHTEASQLYFKTLELEPRNPVAQAGVISLLGRADPASSEARLKSLIAKEPSPHLYSVLGDLYAEQSRWGDAQAAYFQAYNLAPGNQDYAFNLAVSLEHISQPKLALTYYQKALDLAHERASFDRAAVQARIAQLKSLDK